ncbi:hypothetical protein DPMN_155333 [Dreissena polymorpha]|uniref:Uncharacterized protein n=1 Tax=Dreissena polymorpha TaxID=45954 RepID=A0A9D4FSE9_DREPO|nr:hypothetical protein DPMN_155333 [Dreissena polymorpha]
MAPAKDEALEASQAQVTFNIKADVHPHPDDASSPDSGPQANTDHVAPGEARLLLMASSSLTKN